MAKRTVVGVSVTGWLVIALAAVALSGMGGVAPTLDPPVTTTESAPTTSVEVGAVPTTTEPPPPVPTTTPSPPELKVVGNQLLGLDGQPLKLVGVNRSGAEYACVQGFGIWDGASGAAFVDRMVAWGINSVRVTLNEHCWLGINGIRSQYSGDRYRAAIVQFVDLLASRNLVTVLNLTWTAPGTQQAVSQERMANRDHSADFWRSLAETFKDQPLVIFELYGEPHNISWDCWLNGCVDRDGYPVAGMQELVDAVRSVGARQPLIASGLRYANDLTGWLTHRPNDPLNRLIAGFHLYNFNRCVSVSCWNEQIASVAAEVPLVTTELGQDSCRGEFVQSYMEWADSQKIGYLAWTFNAWDCSAGPSLIRSEDGTPTAYGAVVRDHFLSLS